MERFDALDLSVAMQKLTALHRDFACFRAWGPTRKLSEDSSGNLKNALSFALGFCERSGFTDAAWKLTQIKNRVDLFADHDIPACLAELGFTPPSSRARVLKDRTVLSSRIFPAEDEALAWGEEAQPHPSRNEKAGGT